MDRPYENYKNINEGRMFGVNAAYTTYKNVDETDYEHLTEWVRGFVNGDGDLYLLDDYMKGYGMVHYRIADEFNAKYNIPIDYQWVAYDSEGKPATAIDWIGVQRLKDTNHFYLAESLQADLVSNNIDKIKDMISKAEQKNPILEFHPNQITRIGSNWKGIYNPQLIESKRIKAK
jgi:hypothetical protein